MCLVLYIDLLEAFTFIINRTWFSYVRFQVKGKNSIMAEGLDTEYSLGARNFLQMTETCDKFQQEQLQGHVEGHGPHHQQKRKLVPANLTRMSDTISNLYTCIGLKTIFRMVPGRSLPL